MRPRIPDSQPPSAAQTAAACVLLWLAGTLACPYWGVWAGVGSGALLSSLLVWARNRKLVRPLLRRDTRLILIGLLSGGLMVMATFILYRLAASALPEITPLTRSLYTLFNQGWAPVRWVLLPLIILSEELVWRGLILTLLESRLGKISAVSLGAAAYAAVHLPAATPLLAVVALLCGVYWGALRLATRSLVPPIIAHLVWDLCVMILFPLS